MDPTDPPRSRGPTVRDLLGLVTGFALAGFLLRHWRPGDAPDLQAMIGFGCAYLWFGVAMSGPLVLWVGRVAGPGRASSEPPPRLGRLIAEVPVGAKPEGPMPGAGASGPGPYTFNEILWLGIGGFWTTLTLCLPTPVGWSLSWGVLASIPGLVWVTMSPWIVRSAGRGSPSGSWTHAVASAVVFTWPFAALMLLLGTGMFGS